jgi:cytoskeletal protein CcmA (bactofilin family)
MAASHESASDRASILGPTVRIKGELTASEDLVIHGQIEGSIGPAPRVTIGPDAHVKAGVIADVIVVEGRVDGDLKAQVSIAVRPSANVRGNLEAPVVNIAEGATFNGGVKMEPAAVGSTSAAPHDRDLSVLRTGTAN